MPPLFPPKRRLSWMAPFFAGLVLSALVASPAQGEFLAGNLPDVEVRSLATSENVRLAGALAGRPAVILLADAAAGPPGAVEMAAAGLQGEYGPWFSWIGVLSGPFTAEEAAALRDRSPVRIERLYHDREGALRAALGGVSLPALLLVDGDGAIRGARTAADAAAPIERTAKALREIAAAARERAAGIGDFRLPQVGGGLVSFLDVAGREGTMVVFLQSGCLPCAQELEVLDFARDRRGGETTFVAVFLDAAPDTRIRGFLAAAGATPDFVLRDPDLLLAGRYGIDAAPALLVVDAGGRIALSRTGYRDADRDALYASLMAALDAVAAAGASPLTEARRLHAEACAFMREGKPEYALLYQERIGEILPGNPTVYLKIAEAALAAGDRGLAARSLERYLAEAPGAYGDAEVRKTLAGLASAGR